MQQWTVGLMSGTSLDGIDVAMIETDGVGIGARGPRATYPYDPALRDRLRACLGGRGPIAEVEAEITDAHAAAVRDLMTRHGLTRDRIDMIGFHGHTILHRPDQRRTWQIGDGRRLSALLDRPVAWDFRSADVAAGGQGAPFVPLYHQALAAGLDRPLAVVNIGGVANVTWIGGDGPDALAAFDTGPGNAPLDDWLRRHDAGSFDRDGAVSAAGRVDRALLARLLDNPFFGRRPPKSLDRDDFRFDAVAALNLADGAATLAAFTAASIARAADHFPAVARRWLVTGGGRHNPTLMRELAARVGVEVAPVEAVGWDGDALEAEAFAFLAQRVRRGLPLSVPSTTGVPEPIAGGQLHAA
ncbi:MAG: anhydro-N-acetylmuramic acid kinase [Ferrovibrionaceae bacterium]